MKPFFSIILPTYNQANLLRKCLKSILSQSYKNWELLIIDNNSKDNTRAVINDLSDKRFKTYKINNKSILAKSRNFGINKANSEWICFIDSDDIWYSNKLEVIKKYIDKNKNVDLFHHDLVFTNKFFFFKRRKITDKSQTITKPTFKYFAKNGNGIGQSSVVVKKEILQKIGKISINKEKYSWEDFDTWLKLSKNNKIFKRIPFVLGSIWVGPENISNLDKQVENSKNIKKYYGNDFKRILNINNNKKLWWLEYPMILKDFRDKNNYECLKRINSITKPTSKITYIINYYKFILFIRKIKDNLQKIFNVVVIFKNKKTFKYSKIPNHLKYIVFKNSKQINSENFKNFKIPDYFYERFNNKNKLHILKSKKAVLTYGWSSSSKNFLITEINCNLNLEKKIIFYDFKTFEKYRKKGYYKLILNLMLIYYKNYNCYIYTNVTNYKSFLGIKKASFRMINILSIFKNNLKIT